MTVLMSLLRSMGYTQREPEGDTKHALSINGHVCCSCTTTRRSLLNVSKGFPLERNKLRSASNERMEAEFEMRPLEYSLSASSTDVICRAIEVARCAATRMRSWVEVGSPTRMITSRPIFVRCDLMRASLKARAKMTSISILVNWLFMSTTLYLATGDEASMRNHGNKRLGHVSFSIRYTRRRKAIWHTRRGVELFQPSMSVWLLSTTLVLPLICSSMVADTESVTIPIRTATTSSPAAIIKK
mmetsp:Transcript_27691/g.56851  ORF Transcript_27691/g.56851 Transcript_27691/m.56851 type:complete len:243 (+) Transcript_27691:2375-3103(+)